MYYASTVSPPHDMSFLNIENSWNLFTTRLFEKECCPPELENIGKHIVQKCQGLPLSIVVIAGLFAKMDLTYDNWKKVEENLKSCVGVVSEQCLAILSLSYNYLPQHLKACFIYIGGFPEDMEIDVSKLINLWIGEQFVKARSHTKLQVVAEEYLKDLVDRSLIFVGRRRANGRIKTCKIHDLLRQLCIREAEIEKAVHVIRKGASNFAKGIHDQRRVIAQLSLPWEHLVHLRPRGGIKITTCSFVCMTKSNQMIYGPSPQPFVSQFKLLKVLDVCSMNHDFSRVIPRLVHLRYVAANIDKDIPSSLHNLWNLQTMILRGSKRKVPQKLPLEIWTMSQIRYLDIGSELEMPDCLEAESRFGEQPLFLNGLQTLALKYCSPMKEILRRCPNFNKLSIYKTLFTGPEWSGLFDCLVLLQELETLHVDGNISMITHSFISSRDIFLPNLKQVRLTRSNLPWEYMVVMAKLPNLEVLKIQFECGVTNSTDWRLNEEVAFQKLKYLRIADSIFKRWEATSDNFPMLEQLVLRWCSKLKEIPQGIGEIATLQVIELDGCNLATETSAKKIQEEQESWGNYGLQVLIKP